MTETSYICETCDIWLEPGHDLERHKLVYPDHKIMVLERKP